ncbi:DDT domain-containing protein PTM isoform X2 [Ricinus communis]|uniref:DDT domain-containing protein PTM isoform X2 n=1 Tax=Ricinus communis TaxID=3988 RepID=UPI00201AF36E|nr:DDT domain-containing protein PTM isoform X2 [Ricinus communis]
MEPPEVKKRGRGRPRKRRREEDEIDKKVEVAIKRQALEMRWKPLVGRYVLKEFDDNGVFLGKIVSYESGLYRVDYEDGDCEDLESGELRQLILSDDYFDDELNERRVKLDQLVLEKSIKKNKKEVADLKNEVDRVETSALTDVENDGAQGEGDADSSSDSCEYAQDGDLEPVVEVPIVPPPQLPPSSETIGVPKECVSHLFSVYGFLRSFNILLFLSPFTLDDLVGAINCHVQNTLSDAIHVALMRALRRHLEALSSDGSEVASKCLRCLDWSLLDSLTWPVYLVQYFTVMGYAKRPEWKGFYDDILKREYYSLPVSRKLMILQILCDDVLDCAEIRAEIDAREESEVGMDPDAIATSLSENGPRRVHPRYSKTSACKDKEAMEIIAENQGTKSSCCSKYLGWEGDGHDVGMDGNSDECRLCGMDGTLLCCDGCPSAYHSRCIGVVKMYIPEGPWYCPECTINKLGPTIIMGTSLKGAEIFGVDLYEQVFLGTCNHLLVLRASASTEPCLRYYSQKDILKVLQVLSSSVQHRSSYLEISKAIADYWSIPQSAFSPSETLERVPRAYIKEDDKSLSFSVPLTCKESQMAAYIAGAENAINLSISNVDNVAVSHHNVSVNATIPIDPHCMLSNGDSTSKENCHLMNTKSAEQIKGESTGSTDQQIDPSDAANPSFVDRSIVITTCTSASSDGSHIGHWNPSPLQIPSESKDDNNSGSGMVERNLTDNFMYVGTYFKPYAYINHYMHGDFAASAAAKLAILSSEESRVSEVHKSANGRKVNSDILLQIKAFSAAASRFFWPSSEKKLIEVPRERCGWCHSCKLPSNNRRGCMLNSAALTATKGAMKILNSLRPVTSGEGSLLSISTYILYLGESLCGLTDGSFVNASYREQWRKRVENASSCSAIMGPLLELEENIRTIAFLGDWTKAMDVLLVDSPMIQIAASNGGITQRSGPGGKRHRKQSGVPDFRANSNDDKSFVWWRGEKQLKLVFQQAILPRLVVKRAARQGGSKKILGVFYVDDPELPKRSRQMVWRAAVERSKNASQLALQVRYLDLHVRWTDLVRPEQNNQDGKGSETEASVFRNAIICDKKIEKNKICYGVAFGNQKHLPSRIMKNIIEIEQSVDGKEKYWFSETHVPLFLIKEFEERVDQVALPSAKKSLNELSELQRKQLKYSRRDIFLYLTFKRDKLERCSCASCQHDVLIRNTVKCSACQGYCHKDCTISSTVYRNAEVEFLITCKQCCNAKAIVVHGNDNEPPIFHLPLQGRESHDVLTAPKGTRIKLRYNAKPVAHENDNGTPSTPLSLQGPESQNMLTAAKGTRVKFHIQPPSVRTQNSSPEMKQDTSTPSLATKTRSKICNWGVIWKKKNTEDAGTDFRRKNILFPGSSVMLNLVCNLCKKKYDRDLMYIHCETCSGWFHAEAVEIDESNLPNVVGFKCCRCRRIRSPKCPYDDNPEGEKPVGHKQSDKVSKKGNLRVNSDYAAIAESKVCEPITSIFPKEEPFVQDDDPLLFSLSRVEQITEANSEVELEWHGGGQGPQKLPVRRHLKPQVTAEEEPLCVDWMQKLPVRRLSKSQAVAEGILKSQVIAEGTPENSHCPKSSLPVDGINIMDPKEEPLHVDWHQKLPVRRLSKPQVIDEGMLENSHYANPSVPVDGKNTFAPEEESSCMEWDASAKDFEGEMPTDYELNYEDMEFEPQTYFSFGELLESDDGGQLDGFDVSGNVMVNSGNQSYAVLQDGFYEQCARDNSGNPLEPMTAPELSFKTKHCKMCSHSEPVPELTCKVCDIVIHSHCSPWVESSSPEGTWTCGKCLERR